MTNMMYARQRQVYYCKYFHELSVSWRTSIDASIQQPLFYFSTCILAYSPPQPCYDLSLFFVMCKSIKSSKQQARGRSLDPQSCRKNLSSGTLALALHTNDLPKQKVSLIYTGPKQHCETKPGSHQKHIAHQTTFQMFRFCHHVMLPVEILYLTFLSL